ncbi:MAG: PilN domain-containing protein [Chromatiaceae bacterium]|jgi:type IV pilus assembly protein PilN|nr:PilN domain-containing protein [Chromatiaceae bacterium]
MARINLLPWREAERKRRLRELAAVAAAGLVATLLLGLAVHFHIEGLISNQQSRNQFLRNEISKLNKQIREIRDLELTKEKLLARMNVIQQLQVSRPEVVHLFDEMVVRIPEGVYLTKATQGGRSVVVEGRAQSNARVSEFMRNIEASNWIGGPLLMVIENKEKTGTGMNHFRLRFHQRSAKARNAAEARKAAEAPAES